MRTLLAGIAITLSIVLFSSCQKEIDWQLNNTPQSDSTILVKYIEFDTTLTAGLDTIKIETFEYDNAGRLYRRSSITKDPGVPPTTVFPYYENYTFFYTGNDAQPYKVTISHLDFLGSGKDTVHLFYTNGKVTRDSIRSKEIDFIGFPFEHMAVNLFADNGNTTTVTRYFTSTLNPPSWPPACPGTDIYTKTYVNGNTTSEKGNYTDCAGIGMSELNLVYDNHPNPLFPYRVPYPILSNCLSAEQKNNIVESWTFTGQDWYKYSYTYRSGGYPLVIRAQEVADPTNAWKGIYIYK